MTNIKYSMGKLPTHLTNAVNKFKNRNKHSGAYLAHDIGQNGTRGPDERSNNSHQIVVQHKSFGTQSPARVAVQHGDDDWHISTYL